jgi:GT2 family glycosyltransferase
MPSDFGVSVVLGTYNRCEMLPMALRSLMEQEAGALRYEVIVVDNNSTDRTRTVVEEMIPAHSGRLRYLFDGRQGVSNARNTGIAAASAPVVAFTDDDIRVSANWVRTIKSYLDRHPGIDYIGGKVLPLWPRRPPAWLLDKRSWAPLALTDYGDEEFETGVHRPVCLVGASLAVRRTALERAGGFSPHFLRCEDHELQLRMWRAGSCGAYVPELVVHADIQSERLGKAYHRRWYGTNGQEHARMRWAESLEPDGSLRPAPLLGTTLGGAPLPLYRGALSHAGSCLLLYLAGRTESAFWHECELRRASGYMRTCWSTASVRSVGAELPGFARWAGRAVHRLRV